MLSCSLIMLQILILTLISASVLNATHNWEDIEFLKDNFFTNLRENPIVKGSNESKIKEFIDLHVDNYISFIYNIDEEVNNSERFKRNIEDGHHLSMDEISVHELSGFNELLHIEVSDPRDAMLVRHKNDTMENWYAIVLDAESLIIYKFNGEQDFVKLTSYAIMDGKKISTVTRSISTLITIAQSGPTMILEFSFDENLSKLQTLNMSSSIDALVWNAASNIFMTVIPESKQHSSSDNVAIFKWHGNYFDEINIVETFNARSVNAFTIGDEYFVVFANQQHNGKLNIFSEIYKFNRISNHFELYQKIYTNGAIDVKFFCYRQDAKKESYLIFANGYGSNNDDDVIYETSSVVYKYLDGYFVPFQNIVLNDLIEWLPLVGIDGQFVLIASTKSGLHCYQYSGWKFVKVDVPKLPNELKSEIAGIHSHIFFDVPVMVVLSLRYVIIYQPNFIAVNAYNDYIESLQNWCFEQIEILEKCKHSTTSDVKKSKRSVLPSFDVPPHLFVSDEQTAFKNALQRDQIILGIQESQLHESYLNEGVNHIAGDIFVDNLIVNNDAFLTNLNTDNIIGFNVKDIQDNIVNIHEGFVIHDSLHISSVSVGNQILPETINDVAFDDILYQGDDIVLEDLTVKGITFFEDAISVDGGINGIHISSDEVLLNVDDQVIGTDVNATNVKVKNLSTEFLNKLKISEATSQKEIGLKLTSLDTLSVDNLVIYGTINLLDVHTLHKYALRNTGNQTISSEYIFNELIVDDLVVKKRLSNVLVPDDLVGIDEGSHLLQNDVQFIEPVHIEHLILTERLNQIQVTNKRLDVLLNDTDNVQKIDGFKRFENIQLNHPIYLQAKFTSNDSAKMNPMKIINEPIFVKGDVSIESLATIEETLVSDDIVSAESKYSIKNLQEHGLKLSDTEIPMSVELLQPFQVDELYANKINDLDVNSWLIPGAEETQLFSGAIVVNGDLVINGNVNFQNVNNVDITELIDNTLTISDDQTISGNVVVKEITADVINGIHIKAGSSDWNQVVMKDSNELIMGKTVVLKSAKIPKLSTDSLQTSALINSINFNDMINDTVFFNQPLKQQIVGLKTLAHLSASAVVCHNTEQFDMTILPQILQHPDTVLGADVVLSDEIITKHIVFTGLLNDKLHADTVNGGLASLGDKLVGDRYFENVEIFGQAFIESNHINDVNLTEMVVNSIKQHDHHKFNTGTFSNDIISSSPMLLDGIIENLDLNFVAVNFDQDTLNNIKFASNVHIDGTLSINGLVNGKLNLHELNEFVNPQFIDDERHMIINGNVTFMKGLQVNNVNGFHLQLLHEMAWVEGQPIKLQQHAVFDEVVFNEDITVNGFLDQLDINWFVHNYLSKTREQNITAHYSINGVNFLSGVSSPSAKIKGTLSGINLAEFARTAILDGVDQVFEHQLMLERVQMINIGGAFLVNGYQLENDVMRYNSENIVVGEKIVSNVLANKLSIKPGLKVQNIDAQHWLENAASRFESFQINGKLILNSTTIFENNLGLQGTMNKLPFDVNTILLKSVAQNVTGSKIFQSRLAKPTSFHAINTPIINNIDVDKLFKYQVFKDEPAIFESEVNIFNTITAQRVNFNGIVNGVPMAQVLDDLVETDTINYDQGKFDQLMELAGDIHTAVQNQAYYLDDYQLQGTIENAHDVVPTRFYDGNFRLAVLRKVKNSSDIVSFLAWDNVNEQFVVNLGSLQIKIDADITYMAAIDFARYSFLYIESKNYDVDSHDFYDGNLLRITNSSSFELIDTKYTSGSKLVRHLHLAELQRDCIVFVYGGEEFVDIMCEDSDEVGAKLRLDYKLKIPNVRDVTSVNVGNATYLVVIGDENIAGTLENCVQIWRFDATKASFYVDDIVKMTSAVSVSAVVMINSRKKETFLAIASQGVTDAPYKGHVEIRRIDVTSNKFELWQLLSDCRLTLEVQFVILPTDELVLYAATASRLSALRVYIYRGAVEKFTLHTAAVRPAPLSNISTASCSKCMRQFTDLLANHFVVLHHSEHETSVVKALIQGSGSTQI